MNKNETSNADCLQRLVRHELPDRQIEGISRKQYRYEIAMPLVLTIDADAAVPEDAIIEMWRRVMREEIRVEIESYMSCGRMRTTCNPRVPNVES